MSLPSAAKVCDDDDDDDYHTPFLNCSWSQNTLSTHLLFTHSQPTISRHSLLTPTQHTPSSHPLNTPSQPTVGMNALHLAADATPIKRGSGLGHRIMNSMESVSNNRHGNDPTMTEGDEEDEVCHVIALTFTTLPTPITSHHLSSYYHP